MPRSPTVLEKHQAHPQLNPAEQLHADERCCLCRNEREGLFLRVTAKRWRATVGRVILAWGVLPAMSEDRIEINPEVMMGKPVIRGTRVTVELLLRKLSEGAVEDDLLDAYPRITREDVRAAVRFAADTVANDETIFVPHSP